MLKLPVDPQVFRRLAERYAHAVDRRQADALAALILADAVIEGPGFVLSGIEEIRGIPSMLDQRFRRTRH